MAKNSKSGKKQGRSKKTTNRTNIDKHILELLKAEEKEVITDISYLIFFALGISIGLLITNMVTKIIVVTLIMMITTYKIFERTILLIQIREEIKKRTSKTRQK